MVALLFRVAVGLAILYLVYHLYRQLFPEYPSIKLRMISIQRDRQKVDREFLYRFGDKDTVNYSVSNNNADDAKDDKRSSCLG